MNYTLQLLAQSWNKDTSILFDYESKDYTNTKLTINSSTNLLKNNNHVQFSKNSQEARAENLIGSITIKKDYFRWNYNNGEEIFNNAFLDEMDWIVIGKTKFSHRKKTTQMKLREGDLIKIGKLMFKLREIKHETLNQNTVNLQSEINNSYIDDYSRPIMMLQINTKKVVTKSCRICFLEDDNIDNPLIDPCNCSGSVRFLHLECLRKWFCSKITIKKNLYTTSYTYKAFQCELCKAFIPELIKYKNKVITMIDIDNPPIPYIILQAVNREKSELESFIVITMKEQPSIKIGRANYNDLRFTDISVSRNHALLSYQDGHLFIEDTKSKFGSLALIQSHINFLPGLPLSIQKGKFHLKFQMKHTLVATLCCYNNKEFLNVGYNDTYYNEILQLHSNDIDHMKSIQPKDITRSSIEEIGKMMEVKQEVEKSHENEDENEISKDFLNTSNNNPSYYNKAIEVLMMKPAPSGLLRLESKKTYNEIKKGNQIKIEKVNPNHILVQRNLNNQSIESEKELFKQIMGKEIERESKQEDSKDYEEDQERNFQMIHSSVPFRIPKRFSNPEQLNGMNLSLSIKKEDHKI